MRVALNWVIGFLCKYMYWAPSLWQALFLAQKAEDFFSCRASPGKKKYVLSVLEMGICELFLILS